MYYAKIDDYFVTKDAIFYRVVGKLDMAPILKHHLNKSETVEEAISRWDYEQHWLACWGSNSVVDGFYPNCEVAFGISSSTYYKTMKHETTLHNVRNINSNHLKIVR